MDNSDGTDELVVVSNVGKKCRPSKDNHAREKVTNLSHSGGGKLPSVACMHTVTNNALLCHADQLTPADIAFNFNTLYENPNKVEQDQALLPLMMIGQVQRHSPRVQNEGARKDRNVSVKSSLLTQSHPTKLPVCRATFVKIICEWATCLLFQTVIFTLFSFSEMGSPYDLFNKL